MVSLQFISLVIFGFITFNIITHPKSRLWKKMPHYKVKRIQVFPSIRILVRNRIIHFHHWFNFALILIFAHFFSAGVFDYPVTQAFLLGGMIQGLSIKDARQLVYKHDIYEALKKRSFDL